MFSLTNRVNTLLLSRKMTGCVDDCLLKFFVQKNKEKVEFQFYKHNMICVWNAKGKAEKLFGEILFVMAENGMHLEAERINQIFSQCIHTFSIPHYEEYCAYLQRLTQNADVVRKMIDVLSGDKKELLEEKVYQKQMQEILEVMHTSFQPGIQFEEETQALGENIRIKCEEKMLDVQEHKLAFMGGYYLTRTAGELKRLLCYKIMEKVFGTNETDGVYFPLRCEGKIYTAVSSFVMDNELLLTGVMADYSQELLEETISYAKNVKMTQELFQGAKRRVIDDIKFVAFQYGEMFAVLPYIYVVKRMLTLDEIVQELSEITLEDMIEVKNGELHVIAAG